LLVEPRMRRQRAMLVAITCVLVVARAASAQPATNPPQTTQPPGTPPSSTSAENPPPSSTQPPPSATSPQAPPPPSKPPPKPGSIKAREEAEPPQDNFQLEGDNPKSPTWGSLEPGRGFLVGRTKLGDLYISAYGLIRYLNQMPAEETFIDHLGRVHEVDTREDIFPHRIMVHLKGWFGLKNLRYQITIWTVNPTDQKNIFAAIGYQFHRAFNLYGGLNGLPGTRTLLGSHPYWLAHDRVMADEFFRPYFSNGVWANGETYPGLWYAAMIANNLSALGITAPQLTRQFAYAANVWWMPTTLEFGPNGGFDDYEWHEELATRFGVGGTWSHEDRFSDVLSGAPDNTTLRLADSLNLFDLGSLAPGVTVERARYRMMSADAGIKYHGLFLGTAYFQRWLDQFRADGPLPVSSLVDRGFYVQAAFYPIKQTLEVYGVTSWVFPEKSAGFQTSYELTGGANWFPAPTRDLRWNFQLIWVNRSPVSSTFGYYTGGQRGFTVATSLSINF
jgi:hypothetical protein